jgi:hypothetical protein
VDALFDLADAVAGAVRRRFPRTMFAVCALIWLSVTGLVVYSFGFTAVPAMIVTTVPPVVLVWRVWQRGLGGVEWPFWGAGIGPIVAWAVLFGSSWSDSVSEFEVLLGSVLAFAYATIYLNLLSAADLLRRRRLPPPSEPADLVDGEPRDTARVRLRRLLQVKIMVGTCLIGGVLMITSGQLREVGATMYRTRDFDGLVCMALPVLIGVWVRLRPLAWVAIGVICLYVLAAVAADPHEWRAGVLRYAWIGPVAVWSWLRAARAWYWPPVPRPVPHLPRPHPAQQPPLHQPYRQQTLYPPPPFPPSPYQPPPGPPR